MSKFQLLRGAVFTPPDRFRLQLLLKRKGPPGRSTLSIAGRSKPFADFLGVTPSRAKQNRAAGGGGEPLCRTAKEGLINSFSTKTRVAATVGRNPFEGKPK